MATPRENPYVWVTWASRLMAGEVQCEWSMWFRAHYQYDRRPSDFDLAKWTADHAAMVREQAAGLRAEGYHVMLEGQNAFKMLGRHAVTLAGKPDIVAERDGRVQVIECKTGSPRVSDHMQVLIYMLILPYVRPNWKLVPLQGCLQYRHDQVAIPARAVDDAFRTRFRHLMAQVGGASALVRVPSYAECQFCDISRRDCPERVETPPPDVMASEHDLF
jgi:hypothetical protein